jgi:hypothetical protein
MYASVSPRRGEPREADQRPGEADPTAHKNMSTKPSAQTAGDFPSSTKNDARTTRKPAKRPTEIDAAEQQSERLPSEMNPSAAHANMTELMLKSEVAVALRQPGAQREHDRGEDENGA